MKDPTCPHCLQPFQAKTLLESATSYARATDSGVSTCPGCGKSLEFRIAAGALEIGYTYWAGSLHFEAVSSHRIRGLRLASTAGGFVAMIGTQTFDLPPF